MVLWVVVLSFECEASTRATFEMYVLKMKKLYTGFFARSLSKLM